MGMNVETVVLGPDTDQYAGKGQPATRIAHIRQVAQRMEALGFDGLTTPEAGHDPFLPIPLMAEHTQAIQLGTNVAIAFPRSPMVTAQIAWDLQQLSGGRFRLGLGSQVKAHVQRRYATPWTGPPGPRMREYLECMQAMFETFQQAKPSFYQGEHYQFSMMNPFFNPGPIDHPAPEILIAAVNPYMAQLAGELCDGLRLHPIATFDFTHKVVIPAVAAAGPMRIRRGGGAVLPGRARYAAPRARPRRSQLPDVFVLRQEPVEVHRGEDGRAIGRAGGRQSQCE